MAELDIVIPAYNERENIILVLDSFYQNIMTPYRVLICYDFDEDTTLKAISDYPKDRMEIVLVKSPGQGPHDAINAGILKSTAPIIMTHMADDDYSANDFDFMVSKVNEGYDIVTASRFMKGGQMIGGIWYKILLTRIVSLSLYYLAHFPTHDATNGVRMFSRRLVDTVEVESSLGFTFTFEMVVKAVRLGWKVYEFPGKWIERQSGVSRFRILPWCNDYLRWYFYAFATTWLNRGTNTVRRKNPK